MNKKSKESKQSAGLRSSVDNKIIKAIRVDYMQSSARLINQLDAFLKGKKVMLSIPNPNKTETNKQFIRVNAKTVWKDPRPFSG